ncbi:hypothetical protein PTKU46_46510 [Paraburkholderia terrae]
MTNSQRHARKITFFLSDEFGVRPELISSAETISPVTCVAAEIAREAGVRGSGTGLVECFPKIDCQAFLVDRVLGDTKVGR